MKGILKKEKNKKAAGENISKIQVSKESFEVLLLALSFTINFLFLFLYVLSIYLLF
jgi:hypothetical protein